MQGKVEKVFAADNKGDERLSFTTETLQDIDFIMFHTVFKLNDKKFI